MVWNGTLGFHFGPRLGLKTGVSAQAELKLIFHKNISKNAKNFSESGITFTNKILANIENMLS